MNVYNEIIKKVLDYEQLESGLKDLENFIQLQGVDFEYYLFEEKRGEVYTNNDSLKQYIREGYAEKHLDRRVEGGILLEYYFLSLKGIVKLTAVNYEKIIEVETLVEIVISIISEILKGEIYKAHSFINPAFYEVSKILYEQNGAIEEKLDELISFVEWVLGVNILEITKRGVTYFSRPFEENGYEYSFKNLKVVYKQERVLDKIINTDKILCIIFHMINSFLDTKELETQKDRELEYEMSSKENLEKLNKLLERSLYKMTFISNLYTKLSKTREINEAVQVIEEFIKQEIGYDYLKIECNELYEEYGNKESHSEPQVLADYLIKDKILYRVTFSKKDITNEEQVYVRLIFNHSKMEIENILLYKKLEELATIDGVTDLFIHRYFVEALDRQIEESNRYGQNLSLVMLDIDNFKHYNDNYGHQEGDKVLQNVGIQIKESIRKVDIPCRYGGEEFIVILPFTDCDSSRDVAERIRTNIMNETDVTVSVGVTQFIKGESREKIVKRADQAMYTAKKEGKNKVVRK